MMQLCRFGVHGAGNRRGEGGKEETWVRASGTIMTSNPETVEPSKTVVDAARIMKQEDAGVVHVTENGRLTGMVTDRDIAIRVVAEGKDPKLITVREVASTNLVTIDLEQDLDEALRSMAKRQVRRLPVVMEDGRLVGVVAQADVARQRHDTQTGQVVQEISQ
jgi:CBS domain-containing protein